MRFLKSYVVDILWNGFFIECTGGYAAEWLF